MAKAFLHHLRVNAALDEPSGMCMADVVQANVGESSGSGGLLPLS